MNKTLSPKHSINELDKILFNLSKSDLRKEKYSFIEDIIDNILIDIVFQIIPFNVKTIFRARINKKSSYSTIEQLIFPRPSLIKDYGRLAKPYCSILYGSSSGDVSIFEVQPNIGDIVTLIQFEINSQHDTLKAYEIGTRKNFFNYLPNALENNKGYIFTESYKKIVLKIEEFFVNQFSQQVKKGEEYKYKITAAISNSLFIKNGYAECLIYPSIAYNMGGLNIGVKPDIFSTKFSPKKVAEYKVIDKIFNKKSKEYKLQCINKAKKILDNGNIIW